VENLYDPFLRDTVPDTTDASSYTASETYVLHAWVAADTLLEDGIETHRPGPDESSAYIQVKTLFIDASRSCTDEDFTNYRNGILRAPILQSSEKKALLDDFYQKFVLILGSRADVKCKFSDATPAVMTCCLAPSPAVPKKKKVKREEDVAKAEVKVKDTDEGNL